MLVELMVENYAVIERLRVRFHNGFNVLSGETGSGKSIVVDALGLLFGGRAAAEMVRSGAERARITGIFEAPASGAMRERLDAFGIVVEEDELLIEREILANGKSRAFAASRPVTAALLRDLAPLLGDIHGQHDQQRLFSDTEQLAILDTWGRTRTQQQTVAERFSKWKAARTALDDLDRNVQDRLRMADLWSYQSKEIEAVGPRVGEDEALEQERRLLQNVTKLEQCASEAYDSLYESASSALSQLRVAVKRVDELARIDGSTGTWLEPMKTAEALIEDVALSLRDYHGRLEADPNRLDHVETRLASLEKLKRKYGGTIEEILAFHDRVKSQLETVENVEAKRVELEAAVEKTGAAFDQAARKLSDVRRKAAVAMAKKVETELASLAMDRTRFEVAFEEAPWAASGIDKIRFLIAPNLGEQAKPLDRIASGGELSRVALALKAVTVTAETEEAASQGIARTLVFDEVDAGIGGRTAESVGRRLQRIAAASQVLCVTHLAQIAGFADHHFVVEKHEEGGRTVSTIQEMTGAARTREISRMLGGQETPESLQHAEQILKLGAG